MGLCSLRYEEYNELGDPLGRRAVLAVSDVDCSGLYFSPVVIFTRCHPRGEKIKSRRPDRLSTYSTGYKLAFHQKYGGTESAAPEER